uniref:Secreted protein n=1 Tax=Heterorhabditis bacteriophora TaxID=37862 RepID=A0A1I7WWK7_HETBA
MYIFIRTVLFLSLVSMIFSVDDHHSVRESERSRHISPSQKQSLPGSELPVHRSLSRSHLTNRRSMRPHNSNSLRSKAKTRMPLPPSPTLHREESHHNRPPSIKPPKGVAKKLNQAQFSEFRALAVTLLKTKKLHLN